MRLKQLLEILMAALLLCAAAAADSQITGINVQAMENTSTITIRATGSFAHNEYRPADNLLLVDFTGLSVGNLDNSVHTVNLPGVISYRVSSYTGTRGAQVARVELSLEPRTTIHLQDQAGALVVKVTGSSSPQAGAANTASLAVVPKSPEPAPERAISPASTLVRPAPVQTLTTSAKPVRVNGVSVVRARDGLDIQIHAAGIANPKVLRLTSPDRVVVDLPNSIPANRPHEIPVNSPEVKAVRMSQFQSAPPVTRVVIDLASPREYELSNSGMNLILKLRMPVAQSRPASSPLKTDSARSTEQLSTTAAATLPRPVAGAASPAAAKDYVLVEPAYRVKQEGSSDESDAARAAAAAATLGAAPPVEIPFSSTPALNPSAAMRPAALNAGLAQNVQTLQTVQSQMQSAEQSSQQQSAPPPAVQPPAAPQISVAPAQAPSAPPQAPQVQTVRMQSTNCNTGRYTGEPISVNLKDVDLKDFFRLIHEISGLNVVLDPGVSGSLTLVLDDVPWDQALAIVLNNNGLECQLEGNVLRIALPSTLKKEADARRAAIEAQALAVDKTTVTRYLSYAAAKDVVPTIKQFLSQRGDIIADERTNGLVISDIPSVIPNIDRLLRELDRKTAEVEIEARVVAATRNFARDLGTQVGFGWGNAPSAVGGATAVGTSPIQNNAPNAQAPNYFIVGNKQIPLLSNLAANAPTSGISILNATNNYRLDVILTAAESRGLLKILSRPRVVTQNNIQAIVRQGVRIPVVTAAQLGGPPTVQYVEAFLRLQVRPQITAEGTIFLNVDVENTTPDFSRTISGNPTLITQQATTQVLVTDGGTVVIGGVIQTTNSVNYQQVPYLGSIPVLGNLFKRKAVSTSTQELIFFITPKIIQT